MTNIQKINKKEGIGEYKEPPNDILHAEAVRARDVFINRTINDNKPALKIHNKTMWDGIETQRLHGNERLTQDEFVVRVASIDNSITITSAYINAKTKVNCKCNICGHEWETHPETLYRGRGCVNCSAKFQLTEDFKTKMTKPAPMSYHGGFYFS